MRFPWDENAPQVRNQIRHNLAALRPDIVASGRRRDRFTLDLIKEWHERMLNRVPAAEPGVVGGFRGSGPQGSQLRKRRVTVDGILEAVRPGQVRSKMGIFQQRLIAQVGVLDQRIPPKTPPDQREEQVLELCAWAHGEVVFVHPFADGNGRMARAVIVGLPPATGCLSFLTFAHGQVGHPAMRQPHELR